MHKKLGLFATASVVALMGLSVSTAKPVLAQGVSSLEEVIVTARRKEENLFEAPLSVTSLTSEDIDRSNIRGIQDLNNFTPGFFYVQQASFSAMRVAPSLRFRGMNNNFADPLQQQGGIFIDGVFLFGGVQCFF